MKRGQDQYLLHWRGNADLHVAVPTFEALRDEGLIGAWGVSNFDMDDMNDLWRIPGGDRCATNQVLYHPASRGIEYDLLPWCAARGLPVVAYSPLGNAGRSADGLHEHPAFAAIARRHGIGPPAAVLAWAVRSGRVLAIPESGDAGHVRDNAQALSVTLDAEDLAAIDAAFPPPARREPLDVL
ncbi:aldo/keto reductase [Xylophilus sp.]|uniref:aldo/keto reductase n=1 Tax=Xylophilus sp. TaxID=2653893 RepID=UPI0013BCCF66|nr:aldo/keto reductase [Xylophilus sp.]KAF1041806.1 MAG: putative oxidoreductase YtbE [Xylophilus sp.]